MLQNFLHHLWSYKCSLNVLECSLAARRLQFSLRRFDCAENSHIGDFALNRSCKMKRGCPKKELLGLELIFGRSCDLMRCCSSSFQATAPRSSAWTVPTNDALTTETNELMNWLMNKFSLSEISGYFRKFWSWETMKKWRTKICSPLYLYWNGLFKKDNHSFQKGYSNPIWTIFYELEFDVIA